MIPVSASSGLKYRPSNESEGEYFMARWCDDCASRPKDNSICGILTATMFFDTEDEGYPFEWQYSAGATNLHRIF